MWAEEEGPAGGGGAFVGAAGVRGVRWEGVE